MLGLVTPIAKMNANDVFQWKDNMCTT